MNRKFVLLAALVAGLPLAAGAQASPAVPEPAAPAPAQTPDAAPKMPPPVDPTAYPAKVALITLNQAVSATNEGLRAQAEVLKKYEPKKAQIEQESAEIATLEKQVQAAPATLPEEERASRLKTIDTKNKQLQRDEEDAQTAFNSDISDALGKVAQKFYPVLLKFVEDNGYTLLLNVSDSEQSPTPILWTRHDPNADITEAVIAAYNTVSKVPPPAPEAPSAPSATHPKPAATPHPAPAKPPAQ